jgi:hypothetical protein
VQSLHLHAFLRYPGLPWRHLILRGSLVLKLAQRVRFKNRVTTQGIVLSLAWRTGPLASILAADRQAYALTPLPELTQQFRRRHHVELKTFRGFAQYFPCKTR